MTDKVITFFTALTLCWDAVYGLRPPLEKPNMVLIVADDMGYGDLSSYGHPIQEMGPVDLLAQQGIRFTQYYSTASICSPSRSSLLTGLLPVRMGIYGVEGSHEVFMHDGTGGLPRNVTTIAEALKEMGYATGMVGKWHLGINRFFRNDNYHHPMHHGFDYVGTYLPWTNHWMCDNSKIHEDYPSWEQCFLYYNKTLIQQPIHLANLTSALVMDAKAFIYDHAEEPFFLFYSLTHMHTALNRNPKFVNTSKRGPYGDDLNEMQWSVGEIVDVLKEEGLEENTLVVFLSDHGPHIEICLEGGSPGILRGGKFTSWEGGVRIPAIMRWSGTIRPHRVSRHVLSTLDILPTMLDLANGGKKRREEHSQPDASNNGDHCQSPNQSGSNKGRTLVMEGSEAIDGISLKPLLLGEDQTEHEILYFYTGKYLTAIRYGPYKLHYYTKKMASRQELAQMCAAGRAPQVSYYYCDVPVTPCLVPHDPPLTYDLEADPEELYPLDPDQYGWLFIEANELVEEHRSEMVMPPSQLIERSFLVQPCCNPPYCHCNY